MYEFKKAKVTFPTRLVIGNLAAWTHGASIVYPSEIFDPKAIVDAVVSERCTALHGVPTHFLGILAELDKRRAAREKVDTSSLRYVLRITRSHVLLMIMQRWSGCGFTYTY